MAKARARGRAVARTQAAAPRITAAAITLVSDIDHVKARLVKLAKRLDIPTPNVAADTSASATITSALAGASSSIAAINNLLSDIDQAV